MLGPVNWRYKDLPRNWYQKFEIRPIFVAMTFCINTVILVLGEVGPVFMNLGVTTAHFR